MLSMVLLGCVYMLAQSTDGGIVFPNVPQENPLANMIHEVFAEEQSTDTEESNVIESDPFADMLQLETPDNDSLVDLDSEIPDGADFVDATPIESNDLHSLPPLSMEPGVTHNEISSVIEILKEERMARRRLEETVTALQKKVNSYCDFVGYTATANSGSVLSGTFKAQHSGLYVVGVTVNSKTNGAAFKIFKNTLQITQVYISGNSGTVDQSGTGFIVVELGMGDTISVKSSKTMYVYGTYSTFTVAKIK
ncbi:Hypothetical predicted protein [Mytilus galloprovincialis]|uniref:C1q domain-containing protein n=1 Tax=Mytilus galloprovincialis TaxID=29158 RepID=A0A8B6DU15_MYTGA|nr:Hypothetical predicted protein [Mytilus galloprovincialis]